MAKLTKDQPEVKSNPYEFILPLQPHELKIMWDKYTDGQKIINFRGKKNGKLVLAELVYLNDERVLSYDSEKDSWNSYVPEGTLHADFAYKHEKAKRHWKQFEEYARKREFAIKQNAQTIPFGEDLKPEVEMLDFWQGN